MDELLAQLILAARNDDVEGWMNILIVVIIAVFWAIGGILKARTKKPEEEEQLAGKPTRRRPQPPKGLQKEMLQQRQRVRPVGPALGGKISRPQPVGHRVPSKKKPLRVPAVQAVEEPKLPEIQPAIEEPPQLISEPTKKPEPGLTVESLLGHADPDELRRAILHYEILGKPLSIRGPGEHIIGL